jgi:hypothetical protein
MKQIWKNARARPRFSVCFRLEVVLKNLKWLCSNGDLKTNDQFQVQKEATKQRTVVLGKMKDIFYEKKDEVLIQNS